MGLPSNALLVCAALVHGGRADRATKFPAALSPDEDVNNASFAQQAAEHERCCCRGPNAKLCRLLADEQLVQRSVFGKAYGDRAFCPEDLGYRFFESKENGNMKTMPEQCGEDYTHPVPKPITVTAYWMRHGFSCANAFNQMCKYKELGAVACAFGLGHQVLMDDPLLTDFGVKRARDLGEVVRQRILEDRGGDGKVFDRVFSSAMLRAMETALNNFPESQVRPTPFCAETGSTADNTPLPWVEQLKKLSGEDAARVLFDVSPANHPMRASRTDKSDYNHFKTYFASVLDQVLSAEGGAVEPNADVPVIIVGHSHYMEEHLACGHKYGRVPRNNEVWIQKYTMELGAWDAKLVPVDGDDSCRSLELGAGIEYPLPPGVDELCPGYVARCESKPEDWLEYTQKQEYAKAEREKKCKA